MATEKDPKDPAPKAEPKTVAGHRIADVEDALLKSGALPEGVDYRPFDTPQFAPSKKDGDAG